MTRKDFDEYIDKMVDEYLNASERYVGDKIWNDKVEDMFDDFVLFYCSAHKETS